MNLIKNILLILFLGIFAFSCSNPGLDETSKEAPPSPTPNPENPNTGSGTTTNSPETFKIKNGRVTIEGKIDATVSDRFGYSVLMIDMNHDSKKDMLISAYYNRRYGGYQGLIYVYLRNNDDSFNSTYSYIIEPPVQGGIMFGASILGIDWNNDGIEDLLVGAPGDDLCSNTDRGAVYVYYGDSTGIKTGNYDTRFCNTNTNIRYFGMSMSKYDIDQDGDEDLVVGAPYSYNSHSHWSGRAYILDSGSVSADYPNYFETTADLGNNAYFGQSVLFVDLNQDGFKDILIGAHNYSGGRVFAYLHDGVNSFATPHAENFYISSEFGASYNYFGMSLASMDIDGDGCEEVLIGNPGLDRFAQNGGAIEIFKDIDTSKSRISIPYNIIKHPKINNQNTDYSYFGYGVNVVDFVGDGSKQIFSQVFREKNAITDYHTSLYRLSLDEYGIISSYTYLDNSTYLIQQGIRFGSASAIVDIDNDGVKDLAISAINTYSNPNSPSTYTGAVFIYKGVKDDTFESKPNYILYPYNKSNAMSFGYSLLGMDINGDSKDDLLVGVIGDDTGGADRGAVYVYNGGENFDTREDFIIEDPQIVAGGTTNNSFGSGMTRGDLNHDNYDDLVISAMNDDVENTNRGAVYIWRSDSNGNIDYTNPPSQTIYPAQLGAGETRDDAFGRGLAILDINPTGNANDRNDLLIGVPGDDTDGTNSGRVYVLKGEYDGNTNGTTDGNPDGIPDSDGDNNFSTSSIITMSDSIDHNSNYFGYSLASGDYNGDSQKDLAVGAMLEDYIQTDEGSIFIYAIKNSYDISNSNADIILHSNFNSPLAYEYWGASVNFYDINGDSKDDLFIGANNHSLDIPNAGIEYIETNLTQYE